MKTTKQFIVAMFVITATYQAGWADTSDDNTYVFKAENVTGWNRFLGQVRYQYAFITDDKGRGQLERALNFCPLKAAQEGIEGHRLLSIITHLHSDHILYGGVPIPTATGFPPGTVLHVQLEWNFPGVGTRLID